MQKYKIIVPIIIVLGVITIWFYKNNTGQQKEIQIRPEFALDATEHLDLEELKSYGLPILIDFGADACPPCKEMEPVLEKLNKDLQGKAIIKFVDVWKNPKTAAGFPLQVIPTQFFFDKEGEAYVPSDPQEMQMQMYTTADTQEHIYTAHQGGMTEQQILTVLKEMGLE